MRDHPLASRLLIMFGAFAVLVPIGLLVRAGHTEGGVDLAKMAGLKPGALICEVHRDDGEMARTPDLIAFCKKHGEWLECPFDALIAAVRAAKSQRRKQTLMVPQ